MWSSRRTYLGIAALVFALGLPSMPGAASTPRTTGGPELTIGTPTHHTETVFDRPASHLAAFRGHLYFTAHARGHGWELFKSDGTRTGTRMLKDVRPGSANGSPTGVMATRKNLFFFARGSPDRTDLWSSDGTRSGTRLILRDVHVDTYDVESTAVGDLMYFFAFYRNRGESLWRSDGTASGTYVVKPHLTPGWDDPKYADDDEDNEMIPVGDRLFVAADGDRHGRELWVSEGTVKSTHLVKDILVSDRRHSGSRPAHLTAVDDNVFFTAVDGVHGRELWKSDGTTAGTALVKDFSPDFYRETGPGELTAAGDRLFFVANDRSTTPQLWVTDGTGAGTGLAVDVSPGNLTGVGGTLFFTASDDGHDDLWESDGTTGGTAKLTDLHPEGCPAPDFCRYPLHLNALANSLYMTTVAGTDEAGVGVEELWVSDGTQSGTERVDTFSPVPSFDPPFADLTGVRDTLYFTARDGSRIQRILRVVAGPPTGPTCHGFPATIAGAGQVIGTSRPDVIVGSAGADTIDDGGGNDIVCAGGGDDTILQGTGPNGSDVLDGQGGDDTLSYATRTGPVYVALRQDTVARSVSRRASGPGVESDVNVAVENAVGGSGNDHLVGDAGSNTLVGGHGNDVLSESSGNDHEIGGAGDDVIYAGTYGNGADVLEGGEGFDTVSYISRQSALVLTLAGGADDGATGEGDTISLVEKAIGGEGDDTIVGSAADDWLEGGYGDDTLTGGGGADTVLGGYDDDDLMIQDGIDGNDQGDGGSGTDTATADPGDFLINVP